MLGVLLRRSAAGGRVVCLPAVPAARQAVARSAPVTTLPLTPTRLATLHACASPVQPVPWRVAGAVPVRLRTRVWFSAAAQPPRRSISLNAQHATVPPPPRLPSWLQTLLLRSKAAAKTVGLPAERWHRRADEVYKLAWIETVFYWRSSVQLYRNFQQWRLLRRQPESQLTRRELMLVSQTAADLRRALPFLMYCMIPFTGATIPIIMYRFPHLLPSTFHSIAVQKKLIVEHVEQQAAAADSLLSSLLLRVVDLEYDRLRHGTRSEVNRLRSLRKWLQRAASGHPVQSHDIRDFAPGHAALLDVDTLPYDQLRGLCSFLILPTGVLGLATPLRVRLREHLHVLRLDDALLRRDGIDALCPDELVRACRDRGLPVRNQRDPGGPGPHPGDSVLRGSLQRWLAMSQDHKVPYPWLVYSSVVLFHAPFPAAATISADSPVSRTSQQ